ncbi:PilZ domain-containing protein [Stieleria sp. TO1_6]|uniref:PilZ domain-containing protein n=1 Tax=Stieleria tagensis TaxID=2956795 RepID=UPI00209A7BA2|nr:PilZ domain-containing protein [Stieleria tagensis]MCO8125200.1 PilZ domain-containing protein [Stieleria tagensis]
MTPPTTSETSAAPETSASDAVAGALLHGVLHDGVERRQDTRIPSSLEIVVQPLDEQMEELGEPFFAITRDISQGGLAYLSSTFAEFENAVVSLRKGLSPGILCRICNCSVIHTIGIEKVCLTNVQFLAVHQ